MNLLVTGGAGYIGSHFILEALSKGHEVIALDNLANSEEKTIDRIKEISNKEFQFHQIDLIDKQKLEKVITENEIDIVVHFAALKSVPESMIDPLKYYHNNINGSLSLLEIMIKRGINKIIFSSSASVYGTNHISPIKENVSLEPINPYASTKVMIEKILEDLILCIKGFKALNLRYFNPVGCHDSILLGESTSIKPTNLFPVLCSVAKEKKDKLNIFGNDYDTHDGTPVRDYIHITDLVDGHIKGIDWILKDKNKYQSINLGTGVGFSVLDVVTTFNSFLEVPIEYKFSKRRAGDAACVYADNSLAKKELSWSCTKDILRMCEDSWSWYSKNLD